MLTITSSFLVLHWRLCCETFPMSLIYGDSKNYYVLLNCKWNNNRLNNFLDFNSPVFRGFHSFLSLLEEKLCSLKLLFSPLICCLDSLGSNDKVLSDALVYDKNHTSFQFECYLVLSLVFLVVLTIFDIFLHLP